MQPIPIDEKKEPNPDPKNIKARYRFVNKIWEITLHLRSGAKGGLVIGGDSTIKNVHPSGHPLALTSAKGNGVLFNVSQSGVRSRFEVRGEPVNHLETRPLSTDKDGNRLDYEPVQGISWETINQVPILVSLGFDQTNCPIRRLNAIELRQQDCRSFVWSLQPNHPLAELDPVPEDPNKGAEGGGGTTPSMGGGGGGGGSQEQQMKAQQEMMKKMRSGMSGGGGGMGTAQRSEVENPTTNNQFERNRYLQSDKIDKKANPPSRHLPLAVQLIAEQSHMHDILLALANSRLRFQITQVEFHHEKNYMPQTEEEKKEGNKEQTSPGGPGVFNGPTMPNMSGMGGGGGGADMKTRMLQQMQMQQRMQSGATGQNNNMMKQQMQQEMMRRSQGGGMMGGAGGGMMGGAGGPPRGFNPMMMQNMGGAMGAGKKTFLTNAPGARGNLMPTGMGSTTDPKQAQNQPDDNLVELTVYGIATLYRAPDPPKPEEQAGQPGTPAADAAPPQGTPPAGGTAQPAPAAGATPNATTQPGAAAPQNKANPPQGTATPPKAKDAIPPKDAAKAPDAKKTEKPADKQPTPPAGAKR